MNIGGMSPVFRYNRLLRPQSRMTPGNPISYVACVVVIATAALLRVDAEAAPIHDLPLRVNCGGGELGKPGTAGYWSGDKPFAIRGKKYRFPQKQFDTAGVSGAAPKPVYETVRRAGVAYRFPHLPNGKYVVRLHFLDTKTKARRHMEFWLEGAKVLHNLDVIKAAGGPGKPYIFEAVIEVTDGNGLEIRGSKERGDDVFISGIEIHRADRDATPLPPIDLRLTAPADLAAQLRQFCGGPVRLVWSRSDDEGDFYQKNPNGDLLVFDSEDSRGERLLLAEKRSYAKPMITDDGMKVVFTDNRAHACFEVSWEGTGLRKLADGYAGDVWRDPETGHQWVYVRSGWRNTGAPIVRHRLDDPGIQEPVWKTTPTGQPRVSHWQLSGDGKQAADAFPWPNCGIADLASGDYVPMGNGCWPAVAPDESERCFYFLGVHTAIKFFDRPGEGARTINLATVPGWLGHKLYHPRWSNHVRFITATAPQWLPETELYIGRFDESFTQIEAWQRVTFNDEAETFGDAWVASAAHTKPRPFNHQRRPQAPAPGRRDVLAGDDVLFRWDRANAKNAITDPTGHLLRVCSMMLKGRARLNPWFGAELVDGHVVADAESAKQVAGTLAKGQTMSFLFTLRSARAGQAGALIRVGGSRGGPGFSLEQHGDRLRAAFRGDIGSAAQDFDLGEIKSGEWERWVVQWSPSGISCWRNGTLSAAHAAQFKSPVNFDASLLFGVSVSETHPWAGSMDSIGIFRRALSDSERTADLEQALNAWSSRKPPARFVVEAELEEASEPPEPETIAPYTRSLAENLYSVHKVMRGDLPDEKIIVLQWVIMDGKELPVPDRTGQRVTLELEEADAHPELGGEHRSADLIEPTLRVFYDVSS